jgi:hypothetical protein
VRLFAGPELIAARDGSRSAAEAHDGTDLDRRGEFPVRISFRCSRSPAHPSTDALIRARSPEPDVYDGRLRRSDKSCISLR